MMSQDKLNELLCFFDLGRSEFIECYNYVSLKKDDVHIIYDAARKAKRLIGSFDQIGNHIKVNETTIDALHTCICAIKTCLRPLSSWQRENTVHLVYQFLQHFQWMGKEQQYEEYDEWGPIIFELSSKQLAYYLWWREEVKRGIFHKTNRAYMWLYIYDVVLNTCYTTPKESLDALESLYSIYHLHVPINTRKHLNKQKLSYIITNYALYNNEVDNIQELIQNYGLDDDYSIYHSILNGSFEGTETHIIGLSSQPIRNSLHKNIEEKEFVLKTLSTVLSSVYNLCVNKGINISEQICGQLNDHVLWHPYDTAILSANSAINTTPIEIHKSFRIGWNYYYFTQCADLSSSKSGVNPKFSLYNNDNGERTHRNGFYYRFKYSGPTDTGHKLIDYIIREIQINYRVLSGKRMITEMTFPYNKYIKNEISEIIKSISTAKYDEKEITRRFKTIPNIVHYEILPDNVTYVPERFQYDNCSNSTQKQSTAMIEIERRGKSTLMDIQKYQVLRDKFELLKDNCGDPTRFTLAQKIIAPMLEMDIDEGIQMWEYVLVKHFDKCHPFEYSTFSDEVIEYSNTNALISAFQSSEIIKKHVFLLNPYKNHLHAEWFIRDTILEKEYELADELISLYIQNNHGENNPQDNLFSLLHGTIICSDTRWKITSEGIDLLNRWIKCILSPAKKAELEVALVDLIDCVEGDAPKGAMSLKMFMQEGSLQKILDDRTKREKVKTESAAEKNNSFELFMEERSQKQNDHKYLEHKGTKSNSSHADNQIVKDIQIDNKSLDEAMAELDSLIGMEMVKSEVTGLINLMKMRQMREHRGLKSPTTSQHLVFSGNPGTGKTTVARIIGKVYHALGFLSKGHLVEVDRSGLVGGYIGQTAIKTQEVIQSALGGILFIDEAYSLVPQNTPNDFGLEAIDTILKAMEDNRDDFIVIVAGYDNLMSRFVNSNPGLKSRFNKYINFPDYDGDELYSIFQMYLKKNDYQIHNDAQQFLRGYFHSLYKNRDDNFGNARDVRNLFEKLIVKQANRVVYLTNPTNEDIITITPDDLEGMVSFSILEH